jgi:hypothetical protein
VRRALILAAVAAFCAVTAGTASATNECRGLMVCVPVVGPWVSTGARQVEFQLACPPRYIVGGLDAELSSRGIDVGFVGALGSPVNPGITTAKEAIFMGRHIRGRDPAPSFRPLIGCVPASGGGRRSPTAYHAFPPTKPTARLVKTVRVRAGATTLAVARCTKGQRLVSASHAVAFYGSVPPTPATVQAVTVKQRVAAGDVRLRVRATRAISATPTIVQLDLLCVPR